MEQATPDNNTKDLELRSNGYIWTVRFVQIILAIVVLANDAKIASQWGGIGCSAPGNIAYVIAISSMTLPLLIYILLTTGPFSHFLWYHFWTAVAFDSVLLVLWIAVVSVVNTYTCSGICNVCPGGLTYYIHSLSCTCYQGYYRRGDDPDVPEISEQFYDLPSKAYEDRTSGTAGVEILLICFTLIWTIVLQKRIEKRRKDQMAKTSGMPGVEMGVTTQSQGA